MSQILVAARQHSVREGIRILLEADHHTVKVATTGADVLKTLGQTDLLLCAEGLDDHDAIDLCRYAQERSTGVLPALVLCQPGSANLPARAQGLEPFALLQMPFASSDLRRGVDQLLAGASHRQRTTEPTPQTELGEIDGLLRAVIFSPSGRMRLLWGDGIGDAGASHLRTLVSAANSLLGPASDHDPRSLAVESSHRVWVFQELNAGNWLALEVSGGQPLGPARLHARRAARQLEISLKKDPADPRSTVPD